MRIILIATFFLSSLTILKAPIDNRKPIKIQPIKKVETTKLDELIEALVQVESGGDTLAVNKQTGASGPLQILPVMVKDVNRISKIKKLGKRFTMNDVWSLAKSKEIFKIYSNYYSKNASFETISRRWYGGPNGDKWKSTKFYWLRAKKFL